MLTLTLEGLVSTCDSLLMCILTLNVAILFISLNFKDYSVDVRDLTNPKML